MKKEILQSLTSDIINITGFPLASTATSLLFAIPFILKRNNTPIFLDWELKEWPHIYSKETNIVETRFKNQRIRLPQVLFFDNTKKHQKNSDILVYKQPEKFITDGSVSAFTEDAYTAYEEFIKKANKTFYNDLNIRLLAVNEQDGKSTLKIQPVEYFDYIRTNLVLDWYSNHHKSTLRRQIHSNGSLEDLSNSPLANNFGINVLIFTIDGSLIIQQRSVSVIVRPNEFCPSASGTLTAIDVPASASTLADVSLMREATEELGIHHQNDSTVITLGITRELIRGGEPEIFLIAQSPFSRTEILTSQKSAKDRFESKQLHFFAFNNFALREELDNNDKIIEFSNLFDRCIEEYKNYMSIPLWTALALWREARLHGLTIK